MLSYIAIRWSVTALLACAALLLVDSIVFVVATHNAWQLVPNAVERSDIAWWRRQVGDLPPATTDPIHPPPAISGREGNRWYNPNGGHGGAGLSWMAPGTSSDSLIAYEIQASDPFAEWPLLRGRALAGSNKRCGFRVGVPLPWVMLERRYVGHSALFVPSPADDKWQVRIRPIPFIANVALLTGLLGFPFLIRDPRTLVRKMRKQCLACGYPLLLDENARCPECGSHRP